MATTFTGAPPREQQRLELAATWLQVTLQTWVRSVTVVNHDADQQVYVAWASTPANGDGGAVDAGDDYTIIPAGIGNAESSIPITGGLGRSLHAPVVWLAGDGGTPEVSLEVSARVE